MASAYLLSEDDVVVIDVFELTGFSLVVARRNVDAVTLSAAVKGKLRAEGDKLLKKVASEAKAAAMLAAEGGVSEVPQRGVSNSSSRFANNLFVAVIMTQDILCAHLARTTFTRCRSLLM